MSVRTERKDDGAQRNKLVYHKSFEKERSFGTKQEFSSVLAVGVELSSLPDEILLKIKRWAFPIKSHLMIKYPYIEHGSFSFHRNALIPDVFLVRVHFNVKDITRDNLMQCMKDAFGIVPRMTTVALSRPMVVFVFQITVEPTRLFDDMVAEYYPKAKQALKLILERHIRVPDDSKTFKPKLTMGDMTELMVNNNSVSKLFPFSAGIYAETQSNLAVLNRRFQNLHTEYKDRELPTKVPGS
jgi:hypothetical protein